MHIAQLSTRYPELNWELRMQAEVVGSAEALDGETMWISGIRIDPRHRGRGYASTLLKAVLASFDDVPVGLAAVPLPADGPGLDRAELRTWYARYGFCPAPLRGDPDRMLRQPPDRASDGRVSSPGSREWGTGLAAGGEVLAIHGETILAADSGAFCVTTTLGDTSGGCLIGITDVLYMS
ncbi:GNAT family N-acetyltransferase [Streptomyces mutabilis]|uniref:GNAT family N-acetyltransferase n=1 Tax=Streptomyces mutabilis TaxID=67332 RepID=UPI003692F8CE